MAHGHKTGGRKLGVPNKNTQQIRDMVLGALVGVGGQDYLERQALENPSAFMTLVGKVLPTQLVGDRDNPVQFVIRGPSPVESASDWLRTHAPPMIEHTDVDTET